MNYTLLIVPALAAALVGSFLITGGACLLLGMARSELSFLENRSWWPGFANTGMRDVVPFMVIVIVLFFRGHRLPTRGTLTGGRQAFAPEPRNIPQATVVLCSLGLAAIFLFDRALRLSLYQSMTATIIVLSIVVLTGYLGQVSLAQAVFAGLAGFILGKLGAETGIPFPLTPLLAAIGAMALGVIVAIPALRVRGIQLAVVTMALGVAVGTLIFSNKFFIGDTGAIPIESPDLFGIDLASNIGADFNRWEYGVMLLIVTSLCSLLVVNLRRSNTGRRILAVRANEAAAAASGVDVAQTKLVAFAISSFLAGMGGAMLAYLRGQLSGDSFSVFVSLSLVAFAYLGGIGLVSGALLAGAIAPGGLVVGLMDAGFGGENLDTYANLFGGIGLIVTAIFNTDGIAGKTARTLQARRARRELQQPQPVPERTMEAAT